MKSNPVLGTTAGMRILFAASLAIGLMGPLHARSIAFTFDDGPDMKDNVGMSAVERNAALLAQLKDAKVESALFVKCGAKDPARLSLVRQWGESGHIVANHSTTHPNFNSKNVTLQAFTEDVLSCDEQLRALPGYAKLFRFPFLKEGDTADKRDGFRAFLASIGYRAAPVSVDTSDWLYNARLRGTFKKAASTSAEPFRRVYVTHLLERAEYYDSLLQKVVGRPAPHVLLLHHNLINALLLKDIIAGFKDRGWQLVGARSALSDPLYKTWPSTLPAGESIVWSLAKEKGMRDLRYPAEDAEYEKPILEKLGL